MVLDCSSVIGAKYELDGQEIIVDHVYDILVPKEQDDAIFLIGGFNLNEKKYDHLFMDFGSETASFIRKYSDDITIEANGEAFETIYSMEPELDKIEAEVTVVPSMPRSKEKWLTRYNLITRFADEPTAQAILEAEITRWTDIAQLAQCIKFDHQGILDPDYMPDPDPDYDDGPIFDEEQIDKIKELWANLEEKYKDSNDVDVMLWKSLEFNEGNLQKLWTNMENIKDALKEVRFNEEHD